jgi:hypothetical protein
MFSYKKVNNQSSMGVGLIDPQKNTDEHGSGSVCRPAEAGPFGPRQDGAVRALSVATSTHYSGRHQLPG